MKRHNGVIWALVLCTVPAMRGEFFERGRQMLSCHRMALRDVPENTIESLREAKSLGCDVVEIDIWKTLDGELMLLHDGPIDRVSTGSGEIEKMLSSELGLYDAGRWFNARFAGLRHPRFIDALRYAKDSGMKLSLDHKSQGISRQVYEIVKSEGMLGRVEFSGRLELPKDLPGLERQATASWKPSMTREDVAALQKQGKFVVAGFSAHDHELDFPMMQRAAAAGVDVLGTDHPRLGADAIGRSLEKRALDLAATAGHGSELKSRLQAIEELRLMRDLPVAGVLAQLVRDRDSVISRAAAVALVQRQEGQAIAALVRQSQTERFPAYAIANVAWCAGMLQMTEPAVRTWLLQNAGSEEALIAMEALRAISRIAMDVPADLLVRRLGDQNAMVRGAAARALLRHDPGQSGVVVTAAKKLQVEMYEHWKTYGKPAEVGVFGKHRTTFERPAPATEQGRQQIARAHELYRGYHNMLGALAAADNPAAVRWLHEEALRVAPDFSGIGSYVAATQLWDRADPELMRSGLEAEDPMARDRAQWTMIKRGIASAAALRQELRSTDQDARLRAAQSLAWLGDSEAIPLLQKLAESDGKPGEPYRWAVGKIREIERLRGYEENGSAPRR